MTFGTNKSLLLDNVIMSVATSAKVLSVMMMLHGCSGPSQPVDLKYKAAGPRPEILAVYEAWFGLPNHMNVGYTSTDPELLRSQIQKAQAMGIAGFVVDWYGDRDNAIDKSYATLQNLAAKNQFKVAMMYDEADQSEGATDVVIADFTMFHDTYLAGNAKGRKAYLTYNGRPLIFVFPHGGHTDWAKVRTVVDKWDSPPLLIQENLPGPHPDAFDGFYPWVKGWAPDGSNWGQDYLADFYHNMATKYPDKMTIGGAWPQFDDSKASWGLNRHISARCGQTFSDTMGLWRQFYPAGQVIPYMMIETWNDYEEGSAIERGLPTCSGKPAAGQPVVRQPAADPVPLTK
jgi:hypothetical protein